MDLTHLRELHFTHDPNTGEVGFTALSERRGGQLVRWSSTGRYEKATDQPQFEMNTDRDMIEEPWDGPYRKFVGGRYHAGIKLVARWDFERMVREVQPAGATLLPDVEQIRAAAQAILDQEPAGRVLACGLDRYCNELVCGRRTGAECFAAGHNKRLDQGINLGRSSDCDEQDTESSPEVERADG